MNRNVESLANRRFDVIVVGGGIYGACLAWEATSRGLSVALLEKGDFGGGTSANMHRILHGGFRYVRNGDVKRIRESIRERNTLMRLAPHLTDPMPFMVPTYRRGLQHREMMRTAIRIYDLLSYGRNSGIEDARRQIPPGRIVSREECLRVAPGLDAQGVTGGAIWFDGALRDPARLTLEFVRTAADAGASVANYVELKEYSRTDSRVTGVSAVDLLTGNELHLEGSMVINAAGPWNESLLAKLGQPRKRRRYVRSVDVVTRALTLEDHGLALTGPQENAPDQIIRYFLSSWRGLSVVGSVDYLEDTDPDAFRMKESELEYLIGVVGACMPGARLSMDDVLCVQAGLIPHADTQPLNDPYNAERHYQIEDHGKRDGIEGLFSVMGIKYTTARDIAQKTIDLVAEKLGRPPVSSRSATAPLHGTPSGPFDEFSGRVVASKPHGLSVTVMERLVRSYGAAYDEVLAHIGEDSRLAEPITPASTVIRAQIVHAVESEMAIRLTDVIMRRTDLGTLAHPGASQLRACAEVMGALLGWNDATIENEIADTNAHLTRFCTRSAPEAARPDRGGEATPRSAPTRMPV